MDREGVPTTAVEPLRLAPPPGLGFAAGVAVGVIVAAIAAQLWLAMHLEPYDAMYRSFGGSLRNLSALAVSPAWRWGIPVATAVATGAALTLGARRPWIYGAIAALAVVLLVATYLWATAPITELAGGIR